MTKRIYAILLVSILTLCGGTPFDYSTKHGIDVQSGLENIVDQNIVEQWTDETIRFWVSTVPDTLYCVDEAIAGTTAVFSDGRILEIQGRKGWGYAYPWFKYIVVGQGPAPTSMKTIKSLFMHELSHIIIYECAGIDDEQESHDMFKDLVAPF